MTESLFSLDTGRDVNSNEPMTINTLFSSGQIRLAEISLHNWGSFHGEIFTARIDPEGTLITGDNGSGKSTLIDGLMALLLPAGKASFNVAAAQGDRSDRTLVSYVRGSYGTEHDGTRTSTLNKRPGAVISGLRALYRADDGSEITLAGLFWMTQNTQALKDLNRMYLVAKRNLTLEELLQSFGSSNIRGLKQTLRNDPLVTLCDDRFHEYQETYCRLLQMENRNAPALLSRALGLKKIDDLTDLIRKLVLEPSRIREDATKAVSGFEDLVSIHNELLTARSQRDMLAPLPELATKLEITQTSIQSLSAQLSALPIWFAEQRYQLWTVRLKRLEALIEDCEQQLQQIAHQEADANRLVESRHKDFIQLGGDRIVHLEAELKRDKEKLNEVNYKAGKYQETVQKLALDDQLTEPTYRKNADILINSLHQIKEEIDALLSAFGSATGEWENAQDQEKLLTKEVEEISSRPDSNIDPDFQKLRDELSESLDIDKTDLMFMGELVDVKPDEKNWQGAIERALGGLRTTLAVPENTFPQVTKWLNRRHTGLHVRVQVVRQVNSTKDFFADGYLRKLQWRNHPYREWLKHHLARFDLHCVSSTEALDKTPFSMTEQGLVHMEKGRFEKKDRRRVDDRRAWQLGFSNKDRLALLKQDLKQQQEQVSLCLQAVTEAKKQLNQAGEREELWKALSQFSWDAINVPYWQERVTKSQQELEHLQQSGGDLEQARLRWEQSKNELASIQNKKETEQAQQAALNTRKGMGEKERSKAESTASKGMTDAPRTELTDRIGELVNDDLENAIGLEEEHRIDIDKAKTKATDVERITSQRAVGIMSAFSQQWGHITIEWLSNIEGLPDFIQYLEKLDHEGLPVLVDRFQERLTRHTTQSLAAISQKMDSEREEIEERIRTINQVLARTEFKKGTFLRLGAKTEDFPHVTEFKKQLRNVLQQAGSEDHELRFKNLKTVVDILDKATAVNTANNLESLRLLDSRYQLSFYAEEVDNTSRKVLDVLASSTGKSGGEKESFAGTVVAASLAYVLTPDGYDRPVYSTVFLDEAFSNTAESVSRRVLKVFKELSIHINLITPYKNLNLARESAKSLLIAERDPKTHESSLCEVTWEEIDQKMNHSGFIEQDARELGIELDETEEA
ncbi:ATP-binding protein [Endozoicomonas arenosclerae]|uniref:ATP-binding protein n=1 Tax=Endozoicomonas arenosclerae TaxID=1633495 RepID=UPI00078129F2|nr:ATP-binding protein [Endozoicomonas arenosclerae]